MDTLYHYSKAITHELAGSIEKDLAQGMSAHLVKCSHQVLACVVAQHELDLRFKTHQQDIAKRLLPLQTANPALYQKIAVRLEQATDSEQLKTLLSELVIELMAHPEYEPLVLTLSQYEASYWAELTVLTQALLQAADGYESRELEPINADERARLLGYLQKEFSEGTDLAINQVKTLAGGYSKQTILVELAHTKHLPTHIILRRDRSESPVASTVLDEFELLKTLHQNGMKVPKPLAVDAEHLMGCPVLITEKAEGTNIGDVYDIVEPSAYNVDLLIDLAQQLALMHGIDVATLPNTLPGKHSSPTAYTRNELEKFHNDWQALKVPCLAVDMAFSWLLKHVDHLSEHASLTHCDFRFHNILTQGNRISAVLDWELAVVNQPARDLGYVYHQVTQIGRWQDFMDAYCQAGGTAPNALDLDYYRIWSDLFVSVYQFRARQGFLAGATQSMQMAYAGESMRQHSLTLLAEHLAEILPKYLTKGARYE